MSDAPAPETRTRTLLMLGLGAVALAALFVFVILPLLGGDDEVPEDNVGVDVDVATGDGTTPTEAASDPFELADPDKVDDKGPAETFEVFSARDPFKQLVDDEAAGGTGTGPGTDPGTGPGTDPGTGLPPASPGASPAPGVTPSPSPGPGPVPTTTPSPAPTGGDTDGDGDVDGDDDTDGGDDGSDGGDDGSANVGGTTVTLVDVFTGDDGERKATITVNGTGYTVGEGDTFGRRFRLLDISGSCSTMLFGDSRFTLCEGEQIRK